MNSFEQSWRNKINGHTKNENIQTANKLNKIDIEDPVSYSKELIKTLKEDLIDEKIARIFCKSACHMPHEKLLGVKKVYEETQSLKEAHKELLEMFKKDIKAYKNLSDIELKDILAKGWGAAGILNNDSIIATKIPSQFHEYFKETDPIKKKYHYCHCPRVRSELLTDADLDSIYCNCGGGFYQDIWEFITGKDVQITVLKNLFDGDDVCQFEITI